MPWPNTPSLRGYIFENPPNPVEVWWEKIKTQHELADGSIREYIKGYRIHAKLNWEDGWIRNPDFSALATIANDSSNLAFVPNPNVPAGQTSTFTVRWVNGPDFVYHRGQRNTWKGTIELMGVGITATATPSGI